MYSSGEICIDLPAIMSCRSYIRCTCNAPEQG
jgi:hypothetical protein